MENCVLQRQDSILGSRVKEAKTNEQIPEKPLKAREKVKGRGHDRGKGNDHPQDN